MARSGASASVSVEQFFQFSLLGLITSGYLAVAGSGYLDAPTIVLTAAALCLRGLLIARIVRFDIPDRVVNALTLAYIGFFPLDWQFISRGLLDATVHLVFFLAVMRVLTARTTRDYLYTATIAFLELLAAALLSVNLNFFIFLAFYLLFAIAAFTSAEIRRAMEKQQQRVARSGLRYFQLRLSSLTFFVTAGILALTAGLFFMLPRTADAAFQRLLARGSYIPGFSNQVTLGQIGAIKNSSRAMMHVKIYSIGSNPKPLPALKWRGNALSDFDGRRWTNPNVRGEIIPIEGGRAILVDDAQRRRTGTRIMYRVDLNGIDTDALFFAGLPEVLNVSHPLVIRTATDSFRLGHAPTGLFRYEVSSFLEGAASGNSGQILHLPQRRRYLDLPPLDPRIEALSQRITSGIRGDGARARAIERYLRMEYGYTLDLLHQDVPDPLAYFLFDRRKGHCEYFASAMTVMLRTVGIPARLVNGFQSGIYNPISELYVIRAADAHSWVEAYLDGRGWTTFDPTPPDLTPQPSTLWLKLAMYADAADTFWQDWVVSYDLGRQVTLAERMERSGRRFGLEWFYRFTAGAGRGLDGVRAWLWQYGRHIVTLLIAAVLLITLGPGIWRFLRMSLRVRRIKRGQGSLADATLLYHRMLHLLRRRGFEKRPSHTPGEFAASLPRTELRALVEQFTAAYHQVRFGGRLEAAPHLSTLLERIEHQER